MRILTSILCLLGSLFFFSHSVFAENSFLGQGAAVFSEPTSKASALPEGPVTLSQGTVLLELEEVAVQKTVRLSRAVTVGEADKEVEIPAEGPLSIWRGMRGEVACFRLFKDGFRQACFAFEGEQGQTDKIFSSIKGEMPVLTRLPEPVSYETFPVPEEYNDFAVIKQYIHRRIIVQKISKKEIRLALEQASDNNGKGERRFGNTSDGKRKIKLKELPVSVTFGGVTVEVARDEADNLQATVSGQLKNQVKLNTLGNGLRVGTGQIKVSTSVIQ